MDEPELEVAPPSAPPPAAAKKTKVMSGTGGNCGVLIMGLTGKKKDKAAEIVARLRGISKPEALEIVSKANMVTVISGISRPEAEKAAALFQQIEVQAKITEKKG